jgi:hypothetical protein
VLRYRLRMTPEQIDSIASVDGAVSITTAAAGIVYLDEMQSLIVDNQLTTVGSGNHAPQRPYAPAVTPAPPDGKFDSHLTSSTASYTMLALQQKMVPPRGSCRGPIRSSLLLMWGWETETR